MELNLKKVTSEYFGIRKRVMYKKKKKSNIQNDKPFEYIRILNVLQYYVNTFFRLSPFSFLLS